MVDKILGDFRKYNEISWDPRKSQKIPNFVKKEILTIFHGVSQKIDHIQENPEILGFSDFFSDKNPEIPGFGIL